MLSAAGLKFSLGRVVATPAALEVVERHGIDISSLLARHVAGDWGDVEDPQENERALKDGARLLSVYKVGKDSQDVLWVITDGETDVCPACWAGIGTCEPDRGSWWAGQHFRTDQPKRRLSTTVLTPSDY